MYKRTIVNDSDDCRSYQPVLSGESEFTQSLRDFRGVKLG